MKKQIALFLGLIFSVSSICVAQTKTVTNADLEKFRQKRLKAEREYRANYERLGLPSPEDLERQRQIDLARDEEIYLQARAERIQNQRDFQWQANAIKSQIVSVEAQIGYLRGQIGNAPRQTVVYGAGYVSPYSYYPYGYYRRNQVARQTSSLPNVQQVRNIGSSYPNATDIRNQATGNLNFSGPFNQYGFGRGFYRGGYVVPLVVGSSSSSQDDLTQQLIYLEQRRAGLYAELEMLENQARRAGVKIN